MQYGESRRDLTRTTFGVLFLLGLLGGAFWIVKPFLSATLWAAMLVIATWPAFTRLQALLWGRRGLATAVLSVALLLVLILPITTAVVALVGHMDEIVAWVKSLQDFRLPACPAWVSQIPLAGGKLASSWQEIADVGSEGLRAKLQPYAGALLEWFARLVGNVGTMIVQFLLTVVIAAILYMKGETAALGVKRFAGRLAGPHGLRAVHLAAGSIRGVAMGVVGTAAAQTAVAGAGLAIASVPGALLLTSAILVLCLAQLGPGFVMIPAAIWKFYVGEPLWAGVLLIFALVSGTMDNLLRPFLIRQGADLPLLLILAGALGGMLGFGIMGIFVGPVILAVCYTLLSDWVRNREEPEAEAVGPAQPEVTPL